jgi:cyclic dehypoxanthinyl futalosine synthase
MRAVHKVGLISTGTMMFGIGDKIEHRVRHLQRIRDVQDESLANKAKSGSGGQFTAFIPWTFQRENTALGRKIKEEPTGIDYLQMLAVSRLFLDNIQHIQASWLTQGLKLGQTALRFGADDMGSIMIEENVVSAAGASTCANEKDLRYQIREAGFVPQQRDILYNYIDREGMDDIDTTDSLKLKQLSVAFAD